MARVAKSHSGVGVCSLVMGSLRAMPVMPAMPAIQRFLTCLPRQSLLARARPKRRSRQSGLPVAMGSPRQVRDFAKATGHLAKTDTLDEAVLARFADAIHPEPRPLPDAASQVLAALAERRHQLGRVCKGEDNWDRLGA